MVFTMAEENQFEAEPFTPRGRHITGVIPPFRAEVFVFEVVPGKLVGITGKSLAVLKSAPQKRENTKRKCKQPQRPDYRSVLIPWLPVRSDYDDC